MSEETAYTNPALQPDENEAKLAFLPRDIAAPLQSLRAKMQTKTSATKAETIEQPAPLWETLSGRLREHIGAATFNRWFEAITATLSAERPHSLRLAFPTRFKRDWVEQHYDCLILAFWREIEPDGIIHLVVIPSPKAAGEELKKAQVIYFPAIPTETRPVVNEIASSALFAAIQGKDRQWLRDEAIASTSDTVVRFTGEQFNQDDHDVFMQLVSVGSKYPAGEYVTATAHSLLKALGRGTGKSQHDQLEAEIKRLKSATFEIKTRRLTYFGNLIHDAKKDEKSGHWTFRLNENLMPFYGVDGYTLIDWEQRKQLKGDLARWLQLEIARHAKPFPVKVETLHRLSGSRNKELRDFRRKLKSALDTLKTAGHIKEWRIDETDLVHVARGEAITDSQRRSLALPKPGNRKP